MSAISQNRSLYPTLFKLAVPLALQNLISHGLGFADNVMVGRLGDAALSGVFLANQVQNILQMLTLGTGAAMVVLAAQYLGKGDRGNATAIIGIAMKLCLAFGALCTLTVLLFPSQVLGLFTTDQATIAEGCKYIRVVCFSYLFYCASSVLFSALRCVHNTWIGLCISSISFFLNLLLNWAFIFGNLGAPALGSAGAALATLSCRILEMLLILAYVRFFDIQLKLRPAGLLQRNPALFKDFIRYGIPIILGDVLWGLGGAVQAAILGRIGPGAVAANTVTGTMGHIFGVMAYSIASASGVIIGRTVGSGDQSLVKEYAKSLQKVFLLTGLLTGGAVFLMKDWVLMLAFPKISNEAYRYASQFLTVLSLTIIGTSYQMPVLTGIVRAGGATHFVLLNDLVFVWLVVIPSALLAAFVFHLPPWAVFACMKSDQILKCPVAMIKLNRYDWMKQLARNGLQDPPS